MSGPSKIYAPYQVLGLVNDGTSTECLPTIHRQGLTSFITTPVDDARALHLYDINLRLKGVTQPLPSSWIQSTGVSKISAIAAYNEVTCVALGSCIGVFFRFRPYCLWRAHEAPITVFGLAGNILISISKDGNLTSWVLPLSAKDPPVKEGHRVTNLHIPMQYQVTCFAHPQSYKNKILLGTHDGRCLLLNLKSGNIIHVFTGFGSSITALEPAPVLDVVAVGTVNGDIRLHNFRVDETIVTLKHSADEESSQRKQLGIPQALSVQAITFRSDADESMLTADGEGNLYVWDLNEKSLRCDVRHVHGRGAMFARFLPGEPVFVSAGLTDNSLKVHIFDEVNGQPRVLRSRDGHHLPPVCVRFCGHDGFSMVSAGMDREVRLVSAVNEARNRSFAQGVGSKKAKKRRKVIHVDTDSGTMSKKLPPVLALVSCNRRERDKEYVNIVTIHEGMEEAHTWRLQHGVKHKRVLKPPVKPERLELTFQRLKSDSAKRSKKEKTIAVTPRLPRATSAALTPCGTFAVVGMEDGKVHSYNLQSGRHLGAYSDRRTGIQKLSNQETEKSEWGFAHSGPVVGLAMDAYGDSFVSAGSEDLTLKFWNMHTRDLLSDAIVSKSKVTQVEWCRVSDLIAVACEDFSVYIYDGATRKLARRFSGHRGPIVDICFDRLGRRVVSAATDSTIKVWDLPSGCLVDTVTCPDAPTSIAMAPSGDYLATTHVNNLSVRLWVDKSKFGGILQPEPEEDSTATLCEKEESEDGSGTSDEEASKAQSPQRGSPDPEEEVPPLAPGIVTLSRKPTSQWTVLSNLKEIRERNKPAQPVQKPASAPFFLPTKKGLRFEFDTNISNAEEDAESEKKSMRTNIEFGEDLPPSSFGKLVISDNFEEAAKLLRGLDPSGVDMEIRTVGGQLARRKAAEYFGQRLLTLGDYELSHAHLSVFLRAHGVALTNDVEGADLITKLLEVHQSTWEKLRGSLDAVSGLSAYFSGQV